MLSNYLAEVWGISVVVVSFALLINEKHLKGLFAKISSEESLFMCGLVSFVIGIATVLAHNIWTTNWQIVITILGWLALLKGLALLFMPDLFKKWTKKIESSSLLPYILVVTLIIGLVITYFGFTA